MNNIDQFMGGGFTWFTGVVEDRFDPEEMNRVKVRCFGFHTEDTGSISVDDLPWATVMLPTTSSGTSSLANFAIAFAAATFISSLIVVALTSKAPLKM